MDSESRLKITLTSGLRVNMLLKRARYVNMKLKCDVVLNLLYRKHAKVDELGMKDKPAELSQEDIEAAKKKWENINLSDGEDDMY